MKKILLIPDSFKGTMSSIKICSVMEQSIHKYFPSSEVVSVPVADGGEGSVDSFLTAVGGRKVEVSVPGPYGKTVPGFYGILPDHTAVIEMAAAAGLPLADGSKEVGKATTYGVGQLILHAAQAGCEKIILGLGGSATNDGGTGAAAALGIRFLDRQGKAFVPVGDTLNEISAIDVSRRDHALDGVEIVAMCDIDNPLCGPEGAAVIFGPQKGADESDVERLDANLSYLAGVVKNDLGKDIRDIPGAGAAGGMGGGTVAFLGGKLQMGIETVLSAVHFDDLLNGTDLVFSGEGKLDSQSLRGKVVIGVARHTRKKKVPLIAVVGDIGDSIESVREEGVSAVFSINRVAIPFEQARLRSENDLRLTMDNLMGLFQTMALNFN